MIPCKASKCILFPACKSKIAIYCNPLLKYTKSQCAFKDRGDGCLAPVVLELLASPSIRAASSVNIETWKSINKDLPNLRGIFPEQYSNKVKQFKKEAI